MEFVKLATVSGFGPDRVRSFRVLGRYVGIVRDTDGSFYATEISCKHQNADLSRGRFEGDIVTCPRHQWKYNLRTGECLTHHSACLRRYPLRIEGDDILVCLHPEPEADAWEDDDFPEPELRSDRDD